MVPSPIGANEQYDMLFRAYLNSQEKAQKLSHEFNATLAQVRQMTAEITAPVGTTSRIPGGSLVHRILRRLMSRYLQSSSGASQRAIVALADLVEKLSVTWSDMYQHEFEVERRIRAGMVDRLAVVDAIQAELEYLRALEDKRLG